MSTSTIVIPRLFVVFGWEIEYDRLRQWVRDNGITCQSCGQENHTECDLSALNWYIDPLDYGKYRAFHIISSASSAEMPVERRQYFLGIDDAEEFSLEIGFTRDLLRTFTYPGTFFVDRELLQRLRNILEELGTNDDPSFYPGLSWHVSSSVSEQGNN